MRTSIGSRAGTLLACGWALLAPIWMTGCSDKKGQPETAATAPTAPAATQPASTPAAEAPLAPSVYESALPASLRAIVDEPFKGDLDEMVKRRLVRVGVTFNRTAYFVDKGVQRGAIYEYGKLLEDELNKRRKTGNLKVMFWFVPLPRDRLLPALVDGKVDMVVAQLTVTPERQKIVDFTKPTRKNVDEVVVSGPGAPEIASVDDLAGQKVFVRKSSTYNQSLLELNKKLKAAGKPPSISRRPRKISRTTTCSRWSTPG
jgi:ABC-type amino acid transport substrate-binding protein